MTRLRMGIIGCGAIAQIQHLPLLREMSDAFEIAGLADLSRDLLTRVGDEYSVPPGQRFLDYHELVASDIDAVIVCPSGSHAPATIAAVQAGKHVLVEKPICFTVAEACEMASAAETAGVVAMVAYMKRYDPAYRYALARIHEMTDIRFIQVNHLHPDNSLHIAEFNVIRPNDIPAAASEREAAAQDRLVTEALGLPQQEPVPAPIRYAFNMVLGSLIHDIGNLHGAFGPPAEVIGTEIWAEGRGISTTLGYEDGKRAVCTWVDLPKLWDFKETMEVYGSRERVIASFPTGFAKGLPSTVTQHSMERDSTAWRKELSWHDNAFKLELQHFRSCVLAGRQPETDLRSAIDDIALVRDIILAYLNRHAAKDRVHHAD